MQAGFDQSGLSMDNDLGDPRRQSRLPGGYATQGQAVSAPYAEANMKAAEKTNPMNAKSQETPVGDRVDEFLSKFNQTEFEPVAEQQEAKRKYDPPAIQLPRRR